MLGGGMRPAGILAAAGVVALANTDVRIVDYHRRTARLADALIAADLVEVDRESVQTNIIAASPRHFRGTQDDFVHALKSKGILVNPHGTQGIRIVLHSNIDDEAVECVLGAFLDARRLLPRRTLDHPVRALRRLAQRRECRLGFRY